MYKIGNLVFVRWLDSCGGDVGWASLDTKEEFGLAEVTTVGWVMRETDDMLVITSSVTPHDTRFPETPRQFYQFIAIPKIAIVGEALVLAPADVHPTGIDDEHQTSSAAHAGTPEEKCHEHCGDNKLCLEECMAQYDPRRDTL